MLAVSCANSPKDSEEEKSSSGNEDVTLVSKWVDSTGSCYYSFFSDNTFTYIINEKVYSKGTYNGTVNDILFEGSVKIVITHEVYGTTLEECEEKTSYTFEVKKELLKL